MSKRYSRQKLLVNVPKPLSNMKNAVVKMLESEHHGASFAFYLNTTEYILFEARNKNAAHMIKMLTYPLNAVTLSGIESVCKGSTKPSKGLKALLAIPVFALSGS